MPAEPDPARLDELLGGAEPRTDEERDLLRLAAELRGLEPPAPDALRERVEVLAAGEIATADGSGTRPGGRTGGAWGWAPSWLAPALAGAVACAAVLAVAGPSIWGSGSSDVTQSADAPTASTTAEAATPRAAGDAAAGAKRTRAETPVPAPALAGSGAAPSPAPDTVTSSDGVVSSGPSVAVTAGDEAGAVRTLRRARDIVVGMGGAMVEARGGAAAGGGAGAVFVVPAGSAAAVLARLESDLAGPALTGEAHPASTRAPAALVALAAADRGRAATVVGDGAAVIEVTANWPAAVPGSSGSGGASAPSAGAAEGVTTP